MKINECEQMLLAVRQAKATYRRQ